MPSGRFGLEFDGFDALLKRMEQREADMKALAEDALTGTFEAVQSTLQGAVGASRFNFNRTGRTRGSIVPGPDIQWEGNTATVGVGFKISEGGLPSIFLMYGTPTITPDRELYDSIFGAGVRDKVQKAQREALEKWLNR